MKLNENRVLRLAGLINEDDYTKKEEKVDEAFFPGAMPGDTEIQLILRLLSYAVIFGGAFFYEVFGDLKQKYNAKMNQIARDKELSQPDKIEQLQKLADELYDKLPPGKRNYLKGLSKKVDKSDLSSVGNFNDAVNKYNREVLFNK